MPINPNIVLGVDYIYSYRFVKILYQKFEESDAFKLGIIDKDGNKIKDPESASEKAAYSPFMRLCFRIKQLVNKVPGGNSKLGSLAAAYMLLKEEEIVKIEEFLRLEEASEREEKEFHEKLDKLVHKTFGKRKEEKKCDEEVPVTVAAGVAGHAAPIGKVLKRLKDKNTKVPE